MSTPLLEKHHAEWFAYACANRGLLKLTGVSLAEAAEVCTKISGTGFTEEVERVGTLAKAFDLAVSRIATAVLEQANLKGAQPTRGEKRGTIVVNGSTVKCNRLEAVAIVAADGITRPIEQLFGGALDGDNDWRTEADGEAWVRGTLSPTAGVYVEAAQNSMAAVMSLKPTCIYHVNAFFRKNPCTSYTFPTTVVTEILIATESAVVVEDAVRNCEVVRGGGPLTFQVTADWPELVRVRTETPGLFGLTVV